MRLYSLDVGLDMGIKERKKHFNFIPLEGAVYPDFTAHTSDSQV